MRPEVLARHVGQVILDVTSPVVSRVAALEGADRASAIALATVTTALDDLGARLATLEARAPVPGPPGPEGPQGPPGPPGRAGLDGKDAPRWQYLGTFVTGKHYEEGDLVTDHGSLFYCCAQTTGARPGTSPDWKLMVKRGQDGKDARPR